MQLEDFAPTIPNGKTLELIQRFNDAFGELAEDIIGAVEPSAHRTAALRTLLESKMTLIHSITHPQQAEVKTAIASGKSFRWNGQDLLEVTNAGLVNIGFAICDALWSLAPHRINLVSKEGRLQIGDGEKTFEYDPGTNRWQQLSA